MKTLRKDKKHTVAMHIYAYVQPCKSSVLYYCRNKVQIKEEIIKRMYGKCVETKTEIIASQTGRSHSESETGNQNPKPRASG